MNRSCILRQAAVILSLVFILNGVIVEEGDIIYMTNCAATFDEI